MIWSPYISVERLFGVGGIVKRKISRAFLFLLYPRPAKGPSAPSAVKWVIAYHSYLSNVISGNQLLIKCRTSN